VWDFALVSVASAMTLTGTTIQNIRLVVNGVAARPTRLVAVEQYVKGKPRNEATAACGG
jgi:xanthine dehydrogenase YagS FAD-binding subunit